MWPNLRPDDGAFATNADVCVARDAQHTNGAVTHGRELFASAQGLLRLRRDTQASVHSRGSDVWRAALGRRVCAGAE